MRSTISAVLVAVFAALLPGCAFLSDRARDFGHCFLVDAQFGMGLSVNAKVGPVDLAVGSSSSYHSYGKANWWSDFARFEQFNWGLPGAQFVTSPFVSPYATQVLDKRPVPRPAGVSWNAYWFHRQAEFGIVTFVGSGDGDSELTDAQVVSDYFGIEASAFLAVVGTRLGFNAAEFGDFVTGWFGLDILGDDTRGVEAKLERPALEDAWDREGREQAASGSPR